jgi:hypothetical protein
VQKKKSSNILLKYFINRFLIRQDDNANMRRFRMNNRFRRRVPCPYQLYYVHDMKGM